MEYVSEIGFLELKGQGESAQAAIVLLSAENIDLIFLDIQMPRLTGIEFLKTLPNPPMIIFTTAYSEYALQSYELNVIDYLVKPIPFERFLKACNKAKDFHDLKQAGNRAFTKTEEYFFIRCEDRFEKIIYNELLYIEAMENYVIFHTGTGKLISYLTLKAVESYLPNTFLKVHKSFIISIPKIESIDADGIIIQGKSIPISRALKEEVNNRIVNNRLLKR